MAIRELRDQVDIRAAARSRPETSPAARATAVQQIRVRTIKLLAELKELHKATQQKADDLHAAARHA